MAQELKFQQRWDFRRRDSDLDSSSDDSKSSSSDEPAFKKHKLVSSLDSPENDETSDTPRFQQNGKDDAGTGGHSNSGKAKKKKIGSSKKDSLVKNAMEREPFRKVSRKKSKTRAYEPASLNDTKIFMESLLEELKVTRENLFIQMREEMQKLIADDTITQAARREGSCGQGAVQVQHQSNFESGMKLMADNSIRQPTRREGCYGQEIAQVEHNNNFASGMKLLADDTTKHPTRREGSCGQEVVQVQHQSNFRSGMKSAADDTTQHPTRREGSYGQETVQVQHQNNFKSGMKLAVDDTTQQATRREGSSYGQEKVQVQHQNNFKSGLKLAADDTTQQATRREGSTYGQETVQVQHQNNFESGMKLMADNTTRRPTRREGSYGQDIVEVQHQNNFESGMNLVADDTTRQPTRREGNYRREIVQVQHQNNFEAVMKAQKCNNGFLERSLKSRRMADSNNQYQVFEGPVEHGQDIGPMTSIEKDNGEGFGLFGKPKFSTSSSDQAAASMYLTLPTVLPGPCVENRRIDSSSCSYNQPGISGNKTDGNTERANRMLEASIQCGYFSGMKQQEQLGRIAQVGSINMGSFGRNTAPTLSIGAGFPVPLNHQVLDGGFSIPRQAGMENLPRENSNILGLRMNGGAIRFSAGSHALQERYVANKQGRLFPN